MGQPSIVLSCRGKDGPLPLTPRVAFEGRAEGQEVHNPSLSVYAVCFVSCISLCVLRYLDDVFLGGGDGRGDGVVHPAITQQRTHPLQDRLAKTGDRRYQSVRAGQEKGLRGKAKDPRCATLKKPSLVLACVGVLRGKRGMYLGAS